MVSMQAPGDRRKCDVQAPLDLPVDEVARLRGWRRAAASQRPIRQPLAHRATPRSVLGRERRNANGRMIRSPPAFGDDW